MSKTSLYLNSPKLWAILPAAGSGRRFSATALKQYQIIQGRTVLEHSVERLNQLPLAGYVMALSAADDVAPSLTFSHPEKAHFCLGGAERVHSVLNALNYLSDIAHPDDWVLVHDAARPCVHKDNLEDLLNTAVRSNSSAILAIPVRDTLKKVKHHQIDHTLSREQLWQAQTPQISQIGVLKAALECALAENMNITDEASALEYISAPVHIVMGRSDNIKITYPDDLQLANLILQSQNLSR